MHRQTVGLPHDVGAKVVVPNFEPDVVPGFYWVTIRVSSRSHICKESALACIGKLSVALMTLDQQS